MEQTLNYSRTPKHDVKYVLELRGGYNDWENISWVPGPMDQSHESSLEGTLAGGHEDLASRSLVDKYLGAEYLSPKKGQPFQL